MSYFCHLVSYSLVTLWKLWLFFKESFVSYLRSNEYCVHWLARLDGSTECIYSRCCIGTDHATFRLGWDMWAPVGNLPWSTDQYFKLSLCIECSERTSSFLKVNPIVSFSSTPYLEIGAFGFFISFVHCSWTTHFIRVFSIVQIILIFSSRKISFFLENILLSQKLW